MGVRTRRPADEGALLQLVYYGFVIGSAIARWLPERFVYGVAHALGSVAARVSKRRRTVERNLARITGRPRDSREVQDLVVASFRSYARYWLETFRLVREGKDFFLERALSTGGELIDESVERHGGAIVVVGHLGNWDAGGAWASARGNHLVSVAEVLRPRRVFDFFVAHRAKLGMTIVPAQPGATQQLADWVEKGAVVAILGDRDLKGRGPRVTFFGEEVPFPAGPASVAFRTKCPILVAGVFGIRFDDGRFGWRIEIEGPIEIPEERTEEAVARVTQEIATRLEGFVARRPEEWHVMQPFWPSDRAGS
ncbi:MAG TPA: phosphatidylinositol mannoside acyltransferase [Actinomycetota bacterium]|nr:phosphatidylinositol mannoside acyltransferase [Actinomycetota bacterium]